MESIGMVQLESNQVVRLMWRSYHASFQMKQQPSCKLIYKVSKTCMESEENMLAKYIIARMFVHDHNHSVS